MVEVHGLLAERCVCVCGRGWRAEGYKEGDVTNDRSPKVRDKYFETERVFQTRFLFSQSSKALFDAILSSYDYLSVYLFIYL